MLLGGGGGWGGGGELAINALVLALRRCCLLIGIIGSSEPV